jgi:eukaryotic-like serine/threonine-protein kinase
MVRNKTLLPLSSVQVFTFSTVILDRCGTVVQSLSCQAQQVEERLNGGVNLDLVYIPGGSYQMGSRHEGGYEDERPIHPVFLQPFWLGKQPITQAQWQAVMGRLPDCRFPGSHQPVENICWKEGTAFCKRLSQQTGRQYSLPSEAQWEYACRAGTVTPFNLGETITTDYVNYVGDHTYRDEPPGIYRHKTSLAGTFHPNPWGLYDMHGNVWEFCIDNWFPDYTGAPIDGSTRLFGYHSSGETKFRIARGGSWHETPNHCRSAMRLRIADDERLEYYGFRVLLSI